MIDRRRFIMPPRIWIRLHCFYSAMRRECTAYPCTLTAARREHNRLANGFPGGLP